MLRNSSPILLTLVLAMFCSGCHERGALTLSSNYVTLSRNCGSAVITVCNEGGEGLGWTISSSDPTVSIAPERFSGSVQNIQITASDFDRQYAVKLIFKSDSIASDTEVAWVMVSAAESCEKFSSKTFLLPGDVPITLVAIPAGAFRRGSLMPEITITRDFYLGQTEVTKAQWEAIMGTWKWESSSAPLDSLDAKDDVNHDPNSPAVLQNWDEWRLFIERLSEFTGVACRLPTSAEWEYACRAGSETDFYFGDSDLNLSDYAWWGNNTIENGEGFAHAVAQLEPNTLGLFDMHGNVAELCSDWYDKADDYASEQTDPPGPIGPPVSKYFGRIVRGGSWANLAEACTASSRDFERYYGDSVVGLRIATMPERNPETGILPATVREIADSLRNSFNSLDGNVDGRLSLTEGMVGREDFSGSILAMLDSNGDAALSLVELASADACQDCPAEIVDLPGGVSLTMMQIPVGSKTGNVSQQLQLAQTEVTKAQWEAVMGSAPWLGQPYTSVEPDSPAVYVSWNDADSFAQRLSELTGDSYRLPTEAEWEYSCRSGSTSQYGFGDNVDFLSSYAWWHDNSYAASEDFAHPVAKLSPNAYGLFDMHGNVWEWCYDAQVFYVFWPVVRGGSWRNSSTECASEYTDETIGYEQNGMIGFRIAK